MESQKIIQKKFRTLGMLDMDTIKTSFYSPLGAAFGRRLVRIGTIGDGSCFFHSILRAFDKSGPAPNKLGAGPVKMQIRHFLGRR